MTSPTPEPPPPPRRGSLTDSHRGRRALFLGLYFCEGAPMGFLWWALPTRLRERDVPPEAIAGLLALLVLPWAFKVVWAPAVDLLRGRRFGLRGWIVAAQLVMGATLLPLLSGGAVADLGLLTAALLAHAVAAATQDAAIDTLAIATIEPGERAAINGWMQVGMLTARAVFGGGALYAAQRVGDAPVVAALVALSWAACLAVLGLVRADAVPPPTAPWRPRLAAWTARLRAVAARRASWAGLAFAATAGAGFKSATVLAGPFLLDHGADADTVAWFFMLPAVACMGAGALAGGWLGGRLPRRRAVAVSEGLAAVLVAALGGAAVWAADAGGAVGLLLLLLAALYLAIGLATTSAYAMFMDLTDARLAATHFCAFMGGINLCEAWSSRALGGLVGSWGYGPAFAAMAVPSLAALTLLRWTRPEPEAPSAAGVPRP